MAKTPDMDWGDFYYVQCRKCRAKSPEFHVSETCPIFFAQVRDAWNTRADLAGPVRVKQLEWRVDETKTAFAKKRYFSDRYCIEHRRHSEAEFDLWIGPNAAKATRFNTLDAAKAAAQADYEARILAALEKPMSDDNREGYIGIYNGPIKVGMTFIWEPNKPHAREILTVVRIVEPENDERRIFSSDTVWSDESRFREAVVAIFPAALEPAKGGE